MDGQGLREGGGGGVNDFLQLHKKSPVNLFFLISNPAFINVSFQQFN